MTRRYTLVIAPAARRQLSEVLPQPVAFAAYEFVVGPLLEAPRRVGKPLRPPLEAYLSARRGTYRILYRVDDDLSHVVVVAIQRRAGAYRPG